MSLMASANKKALWFLMFTVFLDSVGLGIIIPVTPELLQELSGEPLSDAAKFGGWLMFTYALMQFFFAPIIGNLSDHFGRRPVLLVSLAALSVDYLFMAIAPTLALLFVGRLIAGIAGATFPTANAYITDITEEDKRAEAFGLLGAAWGVGFIMGPVIGGLLGEYGARLPFFVAAGLALANVLYGLIVLPESLATDKRRKFAWRRATPVGAMAALTKYPTALGLALVFLLFQIAHDANPSTWTYYTMLKFDWSERDIGFSMAAVGFGIAIVQGGLIGKVVDKFGEQKTVYLGLLMSALAYFGFAYASQGWMMYAFIVPFALGGVFAPALRSILTQQVPANAQGELQGALTSLLSITAIASPLIMTQLFSFFSAANAPIYFPGAAFFTAGVCVVLGLLLFASLWSRVKNAQQSSP